jgi:C_GCAxxG_C_C family probable redox protein
VGLPELRDGNGSDERAASTSPRSRLRRLVDDGPSSAETRADRAESRASELYESGYWCGEAVLLAVNETVGGRMPADIMRLASGFCAGFGGSRCTCGALAGAVMAAGVFAGRTGPDDPWEPVYDFAGELRRRFVFDQRAETCDDIVTRIGSMHLPERHAHCTVLCASSARWVIEIAEERGLL